MLNLKKSLIANAAFSTVSGSVLLIFNKSIAQAFGLENNTLFWVLGLALLLFAQPFGISKLGNITIGVVADIVLCFAVLQYLGLKKRNNRLTNQVAN